MGDYQQNLCTEVGDIVVKRRDGLFSYQLAVAVDDHFQNISHIIRGADLLSSTPRQLYVQRCLGASADQVAVIQHGHLPLAVNAEGQKLSKQPVCFARPACIPSRSTYLYVLSTSSQMLNYRLVAVLIFLSSVAVPLASRWAVEPQGSWFRPFVVWALIVFAAYILQRHRKFNES